MRKLVALRKWEKAARCLRSAALTVSALLLIARSAIAQLEDPDETEVTPSDFAGAAKLLTALAIAAIVGGIWYFLRKRATVREGRSAYRQDE